MMLKSKRIEEKSKNIQPKYEKTMIGVSEFAKKIKNGSSICIFLFAEQICFFQKLEKSSANTVVAKAYCPRNVTHRENKIKPSFLLTVGTKVCKARPKSK